MNRYTILILFLFLIIVCTGNGQKPEPRVQFVKTNLQRMPFSAVPNSKWKNQFPWVEKKGKEKDYVPVKVLAKGQSDWVKATLNDTVNFNWSQFEFFFGKEKLVPIVTSASEVMLQIPNPRKAFEIGAYKDGVPVGQLRTTLLEKKKRKAILIPLVSQNLDATLIEKEINSIYAQANTEWEVVVEKPYSHTLFNYKTAFSPPRRESGQYTGQMRLLRDKYFDKNRQIDKGAFYIFIIPTFSDSSKLGFMVPHKSMGFLPYNRSHKEFGIQLSRTLAIGAGGLANSWEFGPAIGTSINIMDTTFGTEFTFFQLDNLQFQTNFFSTRDGYELVKTNNGTVAYLFWEEDRKGNIKWDGKSVFESIKRPTKKNFLAYRFDVKFILLEPFYRLGPYYISILNVIMVAIILWLIFFLRRRVKVAWENRKWMRFLRRPFFWVKFVAGMYLIYLSFSFGNFVLDQFKMLSGPLPELQGFNYQKAKKALFSNVQFRKESEYEMSSEILIQKKNKWSFKRVRRVLYLEIREGKRRPTLRYVTSSNSLILRTKDYKEKAYNHYVVISRKDKTGKYLSQEVFTHSGEKLNKIEEQENIPKRVLVFVNGYRPTSTGKNFGEAFQDVTNAGLEFPNSNNYIYNFDRYEYWERWGEINLQFQNKINPSITFYADGHFSVSTSNYRSLINFSRVAHVYPKRCPNPKKHICHKVKNDDFLKFISPNKKTENLIDKYANKQGFEYRRIKGKIAGMNVLQELNKYPGLSKNDTLYLVAHSMGYAYSLGMIEVLRGKINFGGFYVIAPENAKSGKVNPQEWQEVWQYGSRFKLDNADPPCLQDGVAPQSAVSGLPAEKRVFIPEKNYFKKGFFDSHFIGYYDWILNLKEGEKGYIEQR